jgi:hypothetical protein
MSATITDAPVHEALAPVEQFIVRVLRREHRMAEARNAPMEARVILDVAQSFADELCLAHPSFDRVRFIHAATEA